MRLVAMYMQAKDSEKTVSHFFCILKKRSMSRHGLKPNDLVVFVLTISEGDWFMETHYCTL
jgi:hypothetical protein